MKTLTLDLPRNIVEEWKDEGGGMKKHSCASHYLPFSVKEAAADSDSIGERRRCDAQIHFHILQ